MSPCIRITLRIPVELHSSAVELAKQQDRSLNWQIVNLMQKGMKAADANIQKGRKK